MLLKGIYKRIFSLVASVSMQMLNPKSEGIRCMPKSQNDEIQDEVKLKMNFSLRLMQFDYKHSDETWELLTYFM